MKDKETKDGEKLESVDSSGESVYSSAKEFDEDYETTLHEPRPSAGRVVHRNNCTSHRADRSGEPFFQPRLDPMSDKNWMIRIKIHVIKTYMWNVKCVSSTMSSRQPYPKTFLFIKKFEIHVYSHDVPGFFAMNFCLWIRASLKSKDLGTTKKLYEEKICWECKSSSILCKE